MPPVEVSNRGCSFSKLEIILKAVCGVFLLGKSLGCKDPLIRFGFDRDQTGAEVLTDGIRTNHIKRDADLPLYIRLTPEVVTFSIYS
jgi:hypothetical protein